MSILKVAKKLVNKRENQFSKYLFVIVAKIFIFVGLIATLYGEGTYFAVDASYSSHPTYSKPAADGSQLMFVARVLTGVYTLGQSGMKVPPPLDDQEPHIRYDSVVDKMDRPSMFIVFHDDQAYLDYLITFKQ